MNSQIKILREKDQTVETKGDLRGCDLDLVTLELPWKNNAHGISCIPCGTYNWHKTPATEHISYTHIAIDNVPDREGVCIHIANYAAVSKEAKEHVQLLGCIATGISYSDINKDGIDDISGSKIAFNKMMAILPESGTLTIANKE